MRVIDVALDPRNGGSEAVWTYQYQPNLSVGDAVLVPLGPRSALGFVVRSYESTEESLGFKFSQLRPVQSKIDGLSLPAELVELSKAVAEETLCSLPVALSVSTPPSVRDRLVTAWRIIPGAEISGSSLQVETLRVLSEGEIIQSKTKKIEPGVLKTLQQLRSLGKVESTYTVAAIQEQRSREVLYRLTLNAGAVDEFLKKEGKRKPAQALTLMCLQSAEQGAFTSLEIKALAGVTDATIKALTASQLLEKVDLETTRTSKAPTLNPAQQLAVDAITEAIRNKVPASFLLFGVTGSGKTEVYLNAAAEALRSGRKILYIVPEIALAAQAIAQLRDRFGKSVAVLHSDLAPTERLHNWLRVRDGEVPVVLGARSALFAPISNIGLIIIDEEHEGAYKQESAPRYHTKSVALKLAELHGCAVVLGSATPSVESFYEAEQHESGAGKTPLTLLSLPHRAASAQLPTVEIHDLSEGYKRGQPSILTERMKAELSQTIERGEQAILFLNRRAYAPFLVCRDCGEQTKCPHCSVSLSFHRRDRKIKCHHCGYQTTPPDICPKCGGARIQPLGIGTEKVEEAVAQDFPDIRVARLDRDVARLKGYVEETLAAFRSGEISVLVGTQMVAKGLDFPNVTLVGVIAADISLNIPDFRAGERTFQLLSQVAGRAGRGTSPGRVVIQTFNPTHIAVQAAQNHDFHRMYEVLQSERRDASYPPFCRLINIVLSGEDRNAVTKLSDEIGTAIRNAHPSVTVLGPVDCPVEKIQNRWRRHVLVKMPNEMPTSEIGKVVEPLQAKGVQVVIDVDPYVLM